MNKYETIIYWSDIDEIYIAEMPELKGCMAHGDSPDEALKNIPNCSDRMDAVGKRKKLANSRTQRKI